MTFKEMIKEGLLEDFLEGYDHNYKTDDGRIIRRVYTGRRGSTLKWKVDEIDFLYRSLYEAYFDCKF